MPDRKVFIHERLDAICQFGWAEQDTMAPHEVRHECTLPLDHTSGTRLASIDHVCRCGLVERA